MHFELVTTTYTTWTDSRLSYTAHMPATIPSKFGSSGTVGRIDFSEFFTSMWHPPLEINHLRKGSNINKWVYVYEDGSVYLKSRD